MAEHKHDLSRPTGFGFAQVDTQPRATRLVTGMQETAQWPAVQQLRRWERERLSLVPGDRLLDVGCGVGDVALALAADVVPGGDVVAIDASEVMLTAARRLADADGTRPVRFRAGDALDLAERDRSFSAVRAERVLQWLDDPAAAVAEMVRVLAPNGRLSLIDTDWRTLTMDVPASAEVTAAMVRMRGDGALAGGRLLNLCRDAGLVDLDVAGAVHAWTRWDPDREPAPAGMPPLEDVVAELSDFGALDPDVGRRFLDAMVAAGRAGRLWASLCLVAVVGHKPDTHEG